MTPERWQQVKEIFHGALERERALRPDFLARACGADAELRAEVESLISAHEDDASFIDAPALGRGLLDEEPDVLRPGQEFGDYEVVGRIGRGGMGEVYLATERRLGREVALKLLPAAYTRDAERLRRFEQEARAASALNHPNIITIYGIGERDGAHFIATEFVAGETLRQRLARSRPATVESLDIAIQIADALSAAHAAGIIHRDIKPENVMLRPDGYVKVLDFGLAKLTDAHAAGSGPEAATRPLVQTTPGAVMGTVNYMSPEQARGLAVDGRTDIWSLGVVLYRLLSNALPFDGNNLVETLSHILQATPNSLTEISPNVDAELQAIVLRCLEKSPAARYQTMSQVADALNAYLDARKQSQLDGAMASTESASAPRPRVTPAKIHIPGVHSRWPSVLLTLAVLLGAGMYAADRTGRVRLRDLSDGWLTPARLTNDATRELTFRDDYRLDLPFMREVSTTSPLRDDAGRPILRAVREPERLPPAASAESVVDPPISDQERARRVAAYRDYLENEGLTKLSDVEAPTSDRAAGSAPSDEAAP